MKKQDIHNEWFMPLIRPATCPCGHTRKYRLSVGLDGSVYALGNYVYGRWRTVKHFCQVCYKDRVVSLLIDHAGGCGCTFELQARSGHSLPPWIRLPDNFNTACQVVARGERSIQLELYEENA
jgi:hypothetical protein